MVTVEAADFSMGCEQSSDAACEAHEMPVHTAALAAYEIDRTEVTQGAYAACIEAGACTPPACDWDCDEPTLPAACVTWSDARAYCTWRGRRLPTEAEWELAARGVDGRTYPWGDGKPTCELVNMGGCGDAPEPVGSHPSGASPYGALDMAGNVVELVADFYDEDYYRISPVRNPTGPVTGTQYVGRGGGYRSASEWQRAASRDWYDATDASRPMGFRCAR
jgi:formylglycine-generating enzyme required for sulfatase activity